MLIVAGAGVGPNSVTLEVVEALRRADKVYVETYTSPASRWLLDLAYRHSGRVVEASRRVLEEESWRVVEEAREKTVVVLSPGDPLIATTHQALLAEASARGVEAKYVPGVSGVTAAKAYSGLSYYRFGRAATAPGPWRQAKPFSVILTLYGNLCIDAHTLILLDVSDEGEMLSPATAASLLLEHERVVSRELKTPLILHQTPLILVVAAGRESARIELYDSALDLTASESSVEEPSSLIAPAPLSGSEAWVLESRTRRRLLEVWVKRGYSRRDACSSYEALLDWLSRD
ncbi:MAG: diphthine synthase [Acidilobaceae archaeon]